VVKCGRIQLSPGCWSYQNRGFDCHRSQLSLQDTPWAIMKDQVVSAAGDSVKVKVQVVVETDKGESQVVSINCW